MFYCCNEKNQYPKYLRSRVYRFLLLFAKEEGPKGDFLAFVVVKELKGFKQFLIL